MKKTIICLSHEYLYELKYEDKILLRPFRDELFIFSELIIMDKDLLKTDKRFLSLLLEIGKIATVDDNENVIEKEDIKSIDIEKFLINDYCYN